MLLLSGIDLLFSLKSDCTVRTLTFAATYAKKTYKEKKPLKVRLNKFSFLIEMLKSKDLFDPLLYSISYQKLREKPC